MNRYVISVEIEMTDKWDEADIEDAWASFVGFEFTQINKNDKKGGKVVS